MLRKEEHTDRVITLCTNRDVQFLCCLLEEAVGDLEQDADAVAGFALCVFTGTVLQGLDDPLILTTAPIPQLSCSKHSR